MRILDSMAPRGHSRAVDVVAGILDDQDARGQGVVRPGFDDKTANRIKRALAAFGVPDDEEP